MVDVLIVFGSSSDSHVYEKIRQSVPNSQAVVISAHRSPDVLEEWMKKTDAKIFVAGAGLAAHLPGVAASQTIKPVIGVPVKSNFHGLDSFLAIAQMPPGIPVLCVGVDKSEEAAKYAKMMLKKYSGVNITGDIHNEKVKKATEILDKFMVQYKKSEASYPEMVNINFGDEALQGCLAINVPLLDAGKIENAEAFMKNAEHGLWVGAGRAENAAIAAVEILNIDGAYDAKLYVYRKDLKQKIVEMLPK